MPMSDQDYGRCISACVEKQRIGIDGKWCAVCQIDVLKNQRNELLTALKDLLAVIQADDLIPESVSYMRQAPAAIEGLDSNDLRLASITDPVLRHALAQDLADTDIAPSPSE